MKSKRFLIPTFFSAFLVVLLLPVTGTAQAVNVILKRVDDYYKSLSALKADIVREQVDTQLGEVDRHSGVILLKFNKKNANGTSVRLDWKTPTQSAMAVKDGEVKLCDVPTKTCWKGTKSSAKVKKNGGSALALMTMSKTDIKANYDAVYVGDENVGGVMAFHLTLTPKTKADFKTADIWITADGLPFQTKMTLLNNDTDTIRLSGFVTNEKYSDDLFVIKDPNGYSIQKM